jgi:hypothetical protein
VVSRRDVVASALQQTGKGRLAELAANAADQVDGELPMGVGEEAGRAGRQRRGRPRPQLRSEKQTRSSARSRSRRWRTAWTLIPSRRASVSACASPAIGTAAFPSVSTKLMASVKIGGLFTGRLFGLSDSWNLSESGMNFHSRSDVERPLRR